MSAFRVLLVFDVFYYTFCLLLNICFLHIRTHRFHTLPHLLAYRTPTRPTLNLAFNILALSRRKLKPATTAAADAYFMRLRFTLCYCLTFQQQAMLHITRTHLHFVKLNSYSEMIFHFLNARKYNLRYYVSAYVCSHKQMCVCY